jgi:hypothetical protein
MDLDLDRLLIIIKILDTDRQDMVLLDMDRLDMARLDTDLLDILEIMEEKITKRNLKIKLKNLLRLKIKNNYLNFKI